MPDLVSGGLIGGKPGVVVLVTIVVLIVEGMVGIIVVLFRSG